MMGTQGKRDLFGGALRCAGIAAAATLSCTAMGDFSAVPGYGSGGHIFGWDGSYAPVFEQNSSSEVLPGSTSYSGNGLDLSVYASSSLMGVSVNLTNAPGWSFTWTELEQVFEVTASRDVLLEWDLTGWDSYINSAVIVTQIGVGEIAHYDAGDAPGSVMLTLTPGNLYTLQAVIVGVHGDGGDGYGFIRLSNVPAPGVLAFLGVGLVVNRRRRRAA